MTAPSQPTPLLRPLGIVLASSPNLHLWPLSRTQHPVQFTRDAEGKSAFQRALLLAQKFSLASNPIVTVNASNLELARQQLAELAFDRKPHLIVEPVFRGDTASLTIASLFAAKYDRTALMVVLDAHRPPKSRQNFDHLTEQMRTARAAQQRMIVGVEPLKDQAYDDALSLQTGAKIDAHHLFEASGQDVPDHLKSLKRSGVLYTTPKNCLQAFSIADPSIQNACHMALKAGSQRDDMIWPQINMWSSLPNQSLDDTLPQVSDHLYLRPMDLGVDAPSQKEVLSKNGTKLIELGNRLFVLQDCENMEIIASDDAALIRPRNRPNSIHNALDAMRSANLPHLQTSIAQHQSWGREDLIERQFAFELVRLTIEPHQELPQHFHNQRTESWLVASGSGEAWIDGTQHKLVAGTQLEVPKHALHNARNTGDTPLIIVEMRLGDFLNGSDYITTKATEPKQLKQA